MKREIVVTSVEAAVGLIANLILILTLIRTWRQWRQVRWYVLMLVVGNMLEVTVTLGVFIGWNVTVTWNESIVTCKFLMSLYSLGPSVANMAVAALSLHVLLTSITGHQGNRLRHTLVLGFFLLLSLPLPVSKFPIYEVLTKPGTDDFTQCVNFKFFASPEQERIYHISAIVALTFFPLAVLLLTFVLALTLNLTSSLGSAKTEVSSSDVVLAGLLGLVMALCCVPYDGISLYGHANPGRDNTRIFTAQKDVIFLVFVRPLISAFVCAVFACVRTSQNRPEQSDIAPVEESSETEEETLVT